MNRPPLHELNDAEDDTLVMIARHPRDEQTRRRALAILRQRVEDGEALIDDRDAEELGL